MVISLATNVVAQFIVLRFEQQRRARERDDLPQPGDEFDITSARTALHDGGRS